MKLDVNIELKRMKKILICLGLLAMVVQVESQRSYQQEEADRLFYEGRELFDLRNYPGCEDKLKAWKEAGTARRDLVQEADYMLVCIAYEQGREDAAGRLERFLKSYPDTQHGDEVCFLLGSAFFAKGDYLSAIEWLNRSNAALLTKAQEETHAYRLAYSLLQTGNMDEAQSYFLQLQQLSATYREAAFYYSTYIDYAKGNYKKALEGFSTLRNSESYKQQSLYYIAQIYFLQKQYGKLIPVGENLLQTYPYNENNGEIRRMLGHAYYQQGNQKKALEMLSAYVEGARDPLRSDLYLLGVCSYNQGDYRKAADALSRTVAEKDALSQNAFLYLGQCYLQLGDKNNARMAFERAATTTYDRKVQETALYNYALLIHETSFSGFGESVTVFEDFLNDFPESQYADKVNDHLVEVYLTTKNYDAALASIGKIAQPGAKILGAKQNVLLQLGMQAFTDQDMEGAIGYFDRTVAVGRQDVEACASAYYWRGEADYRLERYGDAVADFRNYMSTTKSRNTETYAQAYYNLGYSYFKQSDYASALGAFRQYAGLEKDASEPSLADAYNRIGDCQFFDRQFSAAEESYSHAASLQPSAGDYAIYQKGFVLGLQKDYEGKIAMMDKLIRDYPESQYVDGALYEKGRTYVLLETYNMAADAFRRLLERSPQGTLARKAALQLGLLYFNSNQTAKAIEAYKRVIADYPGSDEAKVALQDLKSIYVDMNDVSSYAAYVRSLSGNISFEASEQDSLTYFAAEKLFMRGNTEDARRSFRSYLNSFPQGAFSIHANYYLAGIAFGKKEYAEARQRYATVLAGGDTKFTEESLARKAEIEYMEKDYASALQSFKQLQAIAEQSENREAAKLGIMRCARYTGRQAEMLEAANELLKNTKLTPEIAMEARYVRAKAYLSMKETAKAEADLSALAKNPDTAYGAEAKFLLAKSYFDRNEVSKAEKELLDFIEKGTNHQYWLARGYILISDVYIRKGDDFQARQYLTSLQNNYKGNDDIAGMITERMGKLKK
jgi:TolA-binding protein